MNPSEAIAMMLPHIGWGPTYELEPIVVTIVKDIEYKYGYPDELRCKSLEGALPYFYRVLGVVPR